MYRVSGRLTLLPQSSMIINLADDDDDDGASGRNPTTDYANGTTKKRAISVEDYYSRTTNRQRKFTGTSKSVPVINLTGRNLGVSGESIIDLTRDDDFHILNAKSKASSSRLKPQKNSNSKPLYIEIDDDGDDDDVAAMTFICQICFDAKQLNKNFRITGCNHSYCSDCISKYVASKLQDNIWLINCPNPGCKGILEPPHCASILPRKVFDRWGDALCEALLSASEKFYCPFKDCSALLLDDNHNVVHSKCPECRRLFCARCKVPWHSNIACSEFQKLHKDEREREDIQLMNLAKGKQWKRCPNCRAYVERSVGCAFMICRCKCTFCYVCGARTKDHFCRNCGT
ncbi:unnamed protein product [Cuscuta europaea]|uniref:RBR-type E3 ubiquitin transferase n=1 Tax=Cuscuta europaea TaxID=41803 RepID=A0A9P0ZWR9_CUSEU|nr:unnamed protein product [Cuscuta europaea]